MWILQDFVDFILAPFFSFISENFLQYSKLKENGKIYHPFIHYLESDTLTKYANVAEFWGKCLQVKICIYALASSLPS